MDERIKAVIDADFFLKLTIYEKGTALFMRMMEELNFCPVMHEFVANVELKDNKYLRQLLDEDQILIIYYKDYLEEDDLAEYEQYFFEAYERVNLFDFPAGEDIYQYKEEEESLGEIRSFYMARKKGYIYFMSDDADAKFLSRNFCSSKKQVKVKSLFDAFVLCKEKETQLRWKDINPTVKNAMQKRQDKIDYLKRLYAE